MTNIDKEIEVLVRDFATKLVVMTEADLRQRALGAVAGALGPDASPDTGVANPRTVAPAKRSLRLTPKGIAARKLQGQYLGMLRGLSTQNRIRVKKVAGDQGVAAAIKLGQTLK